MDGNEKLVKKKIKRKILYKIRLFIKIITYCYYLIFILK